MTDDEMVQAHERMLVDKAKYDALAQACRVFLSDPPSHTLYTTAVQSLLSGCEAKSAHYVAVWN